VQTKNPHYLLVLILLLLPQLLLAKHQHPA
jgi:hypothetical protein